MILMVVGSMQSATQDWTEKQLLKQAQQVYGVGCLLHSPDRWHQASLSRCGARPSAWPGQSVAEQHLAPTWLLASGFTMKVSRPPLAWASSWCC